MGWDGIGWDRMGQDRIGQSDMNCLFAPSYLNFCMGSTINCIREESILMWIDSKSINQIELRLWIANYHLDRPLLPNKNRRSSFCYLNINTCQE